MLIMIGNMQQKLFPDWAFPTLLPSMIRYVKSCFYPSMSKYMLERINAREKPESAVKMDKNYFVRERVAVMAHYGMQIRKNEISAKEYAFMVKRMCEDIKSMNNRKRK